MIWLPCHLRGKKALVSDKHETYSFTMKSISYEYFQLTALQKKVSHYVCSCISSRN